MPSRTELVAHDRNTSEIASAIGADLVIFQTLPDLISSVRQFNPSLTTFDCSVFTGEYVTGGVDEEYLQHLESLRADNTRGKLALSGSGQGDMEGQGRAESNGNGSVGIGNEVGPSRKENMRVNGTQTNGADDTVGLYNTFNTA